MRTARAFWFDAAACSGCKACQVACKDRSGLEVGRLWRRVSEVSGGSWQQEGVAWRQDVFAFHLSIACNHCEQPICLEGCPARAITQRADGIVLLDQERCLGCGYCSWVCPYSAPQRHVPSGTMSKCDYCFDIVDQGGVPVCVAACPVRALDAGSPAELAERHGEASQAPELPPLPSASLTQPALLLAPHAQGGRAREVGTELTPAPPAGLREHSLVAFSLLVQTAGGAAIFGAVLEAVRPGPLAGTRLHGVITLLLLAAMATSTLHLGRARRAFRALSNLQSSWLSREILLALLFAAAASCTWLAASKPLALLTAALGVSLFAGMLRVYQQRTIPTWLGARTAVQFTTTTLLLGGLLAAQLGPPNGPPWPPALGWCALTAATIWQASARSRFFARYRRQGV